MLCSATPVCEETSSDVVRGARRPVSRVLSASVLAAGRPFLWDAPRGAPHATNPDGEAGTPLHPCGHRRPYSVLLPVGFTLPPLLPGARCALAAPFRPCPRAASPRLARAVCFLWQFPWGRPRRTLSGTVFPWSPDFPLPDPRGKPGDKQRPSGRLAIHHWRGIAEPVK